MVPDRFVKRERGNGWPGIYGSNIYFGVGCQGLVKSRFLLQEVDSRRCQARGRKVTLSKWKKREEVVAEAWTECSQSWSLVLLEQFHEPLPVSFSSLGNANSTYRLLAKWLNCYFIHFIFKCVFLYFALSQRDLTWLLKIHNTGALGCSVELSLLLKTLANLLMLLLSARSWSPGLWNWASSLLKRSGLGRESAWKSLPLPFPNSPLK